MGRDGEEIAKGRWGREEMGNGSKMGRKWGRGGDG